MIKTTLTDIFIAVKKNIKIKNKGDKMSFLDNLKKKALPYIAAAALALGGSALANNDACTHYNFSSGPFKDQVVVLDEVVPALEKALPKLKKEGIATTLKEALGEIDTVTVNKTGKNPEGIYSGVISVGFDYGDGTAIFTDNKGKVVRANPNGQFVISIPFKADTEKERKVIDTLTSSCGLEGLGYNPLNSKSTKDLENIYSAIGNLAIQIQNLTGKVDYVSYNPENDKAILEIVTGNRKILLDLTNRYSLLETKVDEGLEKLGFITEKTDSMEETINNIYKTTLEIYNLTQKMQETNVKVTNLEDRVTALEEKDEKGMNTGFTFSVDVSGLYGNNSSAGSHPANGFGYKVGGEGTFNLGNLLFSGRASYSSHGLTSKETVPVQSISGNAEGERILQKGNTSTTTLEGTIGYKFGDEESFTIEAGIFNDIIKQKVSSSDYDVSVEGSAFGPIFRVGYRNSSFSIEGYVGKSLSGTTHQNLTILGTSRGDNGVLDVLKAGGKVQLNLIRSENGQLYLIGGVDYKNMSSTYNGAFGSHDVGETNVTLGVGYKF